MCFKVSVIMMPWREIDTVLFDMDGTLLDLHFDDYFWISHLPKRYADHHQIPEATARTEIHSHIQRLEGTLEWYCLDHWSELVDMDIPKLKHEVKDKICIRPHAEEFLKGLKELGKELILVTNSHRRGLELKMQLTGIDRWFNDIITSHDYGYPKEEQNFWHSLHKHHPFELNRSLFIDDTPTVLRSAKAFGIKHLICITAPNSEKPHKSAEEFTGVSHFDEIFPEL